jgi:hypothetical protein
MKGAFASRASRRAISVLPTPVGPIIRMFLGVISVRSGSATCARRQRLRSATATARLARVWPTMCLSSSDNDFRGCHGVMQGRQFAHHSIVFDGVALVGVDAQVAGDAERLRDHFARGQVGVLDQGAGGRLRECTARPYGNDSAFGFKHVAIAGDDQRRLPVGHRQHGFQPAQHAVGAPVLGQFDSAAQQIALMLFQLGFEALEQREGIRRAAGKARRGCDPDTGGAPCVPWP